MIQMAKDLSPDQKTAIESILGRTIADEDAISIRALHTGDAPEWLQQSWATAKQYGLDKLSAEEIEAEIDAARKVRKAARQ